MVTSASQNEKPILWGVAGWKNQGEHEGTHQPCLCKESSTPSLYKRPQPPKNSAMRLVASWDCESHKWSQSIFHLFEKHHLSWSHLCGCTKTVWCLKKKTCRIYWIRNLYRTTSCNFGVISQVISADITTFLKHYLWGTSWGWDSPSKLNHHQPSGEQTLT